MNDKQINQIEIILNVRCNKVYLRNGNVTRLQWSLPQYIELEKLYLAHQAINTFGFIGALVQEQEFNQQFLYLIIEL